MAQPPPTDAAAAGGTDSATAALTASATAPASGTPTAPDVAALLQKLLLGQSETAALMVQLRAESEKQRIESEKQRVESERQRVESERQRVESERQRVESERQRVLAQSQGTVSPATPAQLGCNNMQVLEHLKRVIVLKPGEGPPILTEQQQAELAALAAGASPEAAIVRYMAPHLRALRMPGAGGAGAAIPAPLAMVNSEVFIWLEHPAVKGVKNQRLKPDLFLTWAPFVHVREEAEGLPRGTLASIALQKEGCVAELYEAKSKSLDAEAFGKQCLYHQCFPGLFRSALFNHEQCWLLETINSVPAWLIKMHWTTPGSVRELQSFLGTPTEPPLLLLLRRVMDQLQLATLSPGGRCHLGSGASGHVFAVHRAGDAARTPLALKLLLGCREAELHAEFAGLQAAVVAGAPVVAPVPGSLCIYTASAVAAAASAEAIAPGHASGGYLLSRVGTHLENNEGSIKRAFAALAELHACRVFHGDARTANLLDIDGQAQWIDLRNGFVNAGGGGALPLAQQEFDAVVLAQSMLPQHKTLPQPVLEALKQYNAAVPATVAALAKAVWNAK